MRPLFGLHRRVSRFALVTQRKDSHQVEFGKEIVECHEPSLPLGDDQLAHARFDAAPDQWMSLEHLYGFLDQRDHLGGSPGIGLCMKLEDPLEVGERRLRIDQPRQDIGLGRPPRFPCARFFRYACTSVAS